MWTAFASLIDPKAGGEAVSTPDAKAPVDASSAGKVEEDEENGSTTLPCTGSTLEVDYVKNPTPLYKKVQQEDWTAVANFLDAGYWPGSFFPDPVSPADQARTWVTYFDENDQDKFHWSILPLHLAIILDAPFTTIRRLVELYPDSVKCTDDQNMLPLHIAMRHGSSNRVVDFLFCAFPEALNAKGKNNLTPLDCAIQGKDVVRARILNTFIEKSNDKATEIAASQFSEKIASLKERIRSKECALGDAKSRLEVLEELNELVAQLRESEKAAADFKKENYNHDGAVSEHNHNDTISKHGDIVKEVTLQKEEEEPKNKEEQIVKEVSRSRGKNLEQHVQPHPDRLSKGIKKITNSFLRRGSKDKTEVIKSLSMYNSTDIALSKSWHTNKNNDHSNAKSKADPDPTSDRQGSEQSSPRTEQSQRSASDHGSISKKTSKAEPSTNPKWSFLKGKERSDHVARQNSKAGQRTRTYSEGKIIRRKSKERLKEKSKEKSRLTTSDHFVHQGDEKVFPNNSPEKSEDDQREPPDTKETNIAEAQTAVEDEKGEGNNEIVMEQVGKESGGKMTDDGDNRPVEEAYDVAETEKVTSNPLSSNGEKAGIPKTATPDAAKHKENVIFYKHSKSAIGTNLEQMVSSPDQRNVTRTANVDKIKGTTSHDIDGRLPRSESKVRPKENIEYKESARRHHLRLKQKEEAKKNLAKKQKESNTNIDESGKPKESSKKKDVTDLDPKKTPQFSQRSNSMKKKAESLSVTKNSDSLKEKIEDPSVVHQRSTPKQHPKKKVARSSPNVQDDQKESTSKVKCEPNESTSKVKRDRSKSSSKSKRSSLKEEIVDMLEHRQQSSKAIGERSKSERREPAPSSSDNKRSNSMTKRVQNPSSPRQVSNDIVPKKSTPTRIDEIMQETASVQPEEYVVTQTPKQKRSSKAKNSLLLPSRRKSIELVEVAVAKSGDDSDSHSDDSSTYSNGEDEDDDDSNSNSVYSEYVTGSSDEHSLATGSSCSSTTPSDGSDSWSPWQVWSM